MHYQYSPLIPAIMRGEEDKVKNLLEEKASINTMEYDGYTPLMHAASYQRLNIIKLLLEHKADVNHITSDDTTALHCSIRSGDDIHILKLLLENKADICAGTTPALNMAAIHDSPEIATVLIREYKVDINMTDYRGNTPLMNAAQVGSLNTAKVLLKYKSDLHHKNELGRTARDRAINAKQDAIVKMIDEAIAFREEKNVLLFGLFGTGQSSLKTLSSDYLFDSNTVKMVSDFLRPK